MVVVVLLVLVLLVLVLALLVDEDADLVTVFMVVAEVVAEELDEEDEVLVTDATLLDEEDDEALVEVATEDEELEDEVVETTLLEDEETALPERTPDRTLLPALEGDPS